MKTALALLFVGLLASAHVAAQQSTQSQLDETLLTTPLPVRVLQKISSSTARVGDIIELKPYRTFQNSSGTILLDASAKLYAHVTEVAVRDTQHREARLGILLDRAESKGELLKLDATFCGLFLAPPTIPRDVDLRRSDDPSIGAVLVSEKRNIEISPDNVFYVCQRNSRIQSLPSNVQLQSQPSLAEILSSAFPLPIEVSVLKDLSSRTAKVGQRFELRYRFDPRARLYGHVTEVVKWDKQHPEARLGFVVDRAVTRGKEYKLDLVYCDTDFPKPVNGVLISKQGNITFIPQNNCSYMPDLNDRMSYLCKDFIICARNTQ